VGFNKANGLKGVCFDGAIKPSTGALLRGVAAAIMNAPDCPGVAAPLDTVDLKDCPK
jgi:hypothetical protein